MLKLVCITTVITVLLWHHGILGEKHGGKKSEYSPMDNILDVLQRSGVLMYEINEYDFNIDKALNRFAKHLVQNTKSATLKNISAQDVDQIFNLLHQNDKKNMTIYCIEFVARGNELFTFNNTEWKWKSAGHEQKTAESDRPILESETHGFSFEFILGPSFSKAEDVGETFITKYDLKKGVQYALSTPSADVKLKGAFQRFEYSIFLHPSKENSFRLQPENEEEEDFAIKAYTLVHGMTAKLIENIDRLDPEKDLGVDYRYKNKVTAITFRDKSIKNFIRRWVKPVSKARAVVDLYGIVKKFLKNPEELSTYVRKVDIPRDPHEFEVPGFGDRIFFVDKFPDSGQFVPRKFKANFNATDAASKFILDSLKSRVQELLTKVEKDGLLEKDFVQWQLEFDKFVQDDFKKHREMSQIKHGGPFIVVDKHLAGHRNDDFRPYDRKFVPPFGIEEEQNLKDSEDSQREKRAVRS